MTTPTPRHPQTGQYVTVQVGAPRTGSFESVTGTGATDTESAPPPSTPDAPLPPSSATEAELLAFKLGWQARECRTGDPGPGPSDSSTAGDGLPGFSALRPGRT